MAYLGLSQRRKKDLCHEDEQRGCSTNGTEPCIRLSSRCDLFHFLACGAELAQFKILASKLCLARAPFDYKNR
jgi:hypothetical protein